MTTLIEILLRSVGASEPVSLYGRTDHVVFTATELENFVELVRADERNSWPAEMEAMERQVNILTDALAEQPAQRTWVGLTEQDLKLLSAKWRIFYGAWVGDFARAIEAMLKEKNT